MAHPYWPLFDLQVRTPRLELRYPDDELAFGLIDVSLKVVEGCLIDNSCSTNTLGDGVDANDVPFPSSFPYLALPHSGSDASPHPAVHRQ